MASEVEGIKKMTKLAPPSQRGSSLPGAALPTTASTLGVHLPGKMRKGGEEETAPVRKTLGQKHPVLQVPPREGHSVDPYRLTETRTVGAISTYRAALRLAP